MENTVICQNKKAWHDYEILEVFEAGIVLFGNEVKSLREKLVSLRDSFGVLQGEELVLLNANITQYDKANDSRYNPARTRKLLMHKSEIKHLAGKIKERGLTLVPLRMYFKEGRAKVELALARGKKTVDKRETIKERDMDRELRRSLKNKSIGKMR